MVKSPKRAGPTPSPHKSRQLVHGVENRVPRVCFDVGPPVFIEASAGAAVVLLYLEGFPYLEVIVELFLVFVGERLYDLTIGSIERFLTVLMVLGYSTVRPLSFFYSSFMFLPPRLTTTACLPYVGFVTFRTNIFVHTFFLRRINLGLILTT